MENQIYRICCAEYTCFSATHLNALLRHMAYFENEASLKFVEMLILHAHPASAIDKTLYHRTCKIFRFDFGPLPISILFFESFCNACSGRAFFMTDHSRCFGNFFVGWDECLRDIFCDKLFICNAFCAASGVSRDPIGCRQARNR